MSTRTATDLFRERLDNMLNQRHALLSPGGPWLRGRCLIPSSGMYCPTTVVRLKPTPRGVALSEALLRVMAGGKIRIGSSREVLYEAPVERQSDAVARV